MSQKHNVFSVRLVKRNGKLVPVEAYAPLMADYTQSIEEGQLVEAFLDAYKTDCTNPQLAKIHASIRQLALEVGCTFKEMKQVIKINSGLMWFGKDNEKYEKSFADCSKEEMTLVIEALNEAGEAVNMRF